MKLFAMVQYHTENLELLRAWSYFILPEKLLKLCLGSMYGIIIRLSQLIQWKKKVIECIVYDFFYYYTDVF